METNKLAKRILRTVNFINWTIKAVIIYVLIYNTYFGWNYHPINENEKICDKILIGMFQFIAGLLISGLIDVIKLIALKHFKNEN